MAKTELRQTHGTHLMLMESLLRLRMTNNKQAEHELAELHEKERSLEKALELVREKIRELVNYTDKNKGQK